MSSETGQAPLLSTFNGGDLEPAMDLSLDIEDMLGNFECKTKNSKLRKSWTLSDYRMHITSIPDASEMPNYVLSPPQTKGSLPLFLYDTYGVTRRARINGVEALRIIPPFAYVTENDVIPEENEDIELVDEMESMETTTATGGSDFEFSPASSPSDSASQPEEEEMRVDSDEDSDEDEHSLSCRTSTRESSLSAGEQSYDGSDMHIAASRTHDPAPNVATKSERPGSSLCSATSPYQPAPLRASLSIEWPHDERSMHIVVYDIPAPWITNADHTCQYEKSPSPLSSLTPSPPPMHTRTPKMEPKRVSSEDLQRSPKRSRRSCSATHHNEVGPSEVAYIPPSPSTSDKADSDYEAFPSRSPRRAARGRSRPATSRRQANAGAKLFYCLAKSCDKGHPGFSAPKDRNRHMDTHWPKRFECPGSTCKKRFHRDDALRRHCTSMKINSECCQTYNPKNRHARHSPYWVKRKRLHKLIRPPDDDPLIHLWYRAESDADSDDSELE